MLVSVVRQVICCERRRGPATGETSLTASADIVWLCDDFRLDDQLAVRAAADRPALYVYVHDHAAAFARPLGGGAKWRLAKALEAMAGRLAARGARLDVVRGGAEQTIPALAAAAASSRVFGGRRAEREGAGLDARLETALRARGVQAKTFGGRFLREPAEIAQASGKQLMIFSAFWRRHRALGALDPPSSAPDRLTGAEWPRAAPERASIGALGLTPTAPDWSGELGAGENPGEAGALRALERFVAEALPAYADDRDQLRRDTTSRLSAHLRFGEISPRRILHAVEGARAAEPALAKGAEKFLAELGWRDFAAALHAAHPDLARRPLRAEFERFPWRDDAEGLRAWRRGETGYPIVDAGMRQLWRTGYMPNRVRMIAASFLVKHLLIDWRRGEEWFWDTLCDADPASNPLNWQWVAGSGVDSAPYFRIFNPVVQAERHDADGAYVLRWLPELARLDAADIHAPWRAPSAALARAGVILGKTYPRPIVDHAFARARALAAFGEARAAGPSS